MNINNLDSTNKYVQGSVWQWEKKDEKENSQSQNSQNQNSQNQRNGVQSDERPVLIISNNTFNQHSPSVNCVTITSVLKESPVHIPLHITKDSHIQCEQIHTIPKEELTEFRGIVPNSVISNVKAKLRIQFDMSVDRNTEILIGIRRSLDELNMKTAPDMLEKINISLESLHEKADKGFGLPEIETDFIKLMLELHNHFGKLVTDVETIKSTYVQKNNNENESSALTTEADITKSLTTSQDNVSSKLQIKSGRGKGKQRVYTAEDKKFIADVNNSIETLMEKYDFDKKAAYRMRWYFKKQLANLDDSSNNVNDESTTDDIKGSKRTFTDEDKRFIADKKNSIETLMEKYGFDKPAAYRMRAYYKKRIGNQGDKLDSKAKDKPKKGKHNQYTDEDKKFILDKTNSLEMLMERFGYNDTQAAYKARAYIKKIFNAENQEE